MQAPDFANVKCCPELDEGFFADELVAFYLDHLRLAGFVRQHCPAGFQSCQLLCLAFGRLRAPTGGFQSNPRKAKPGNHPRSSTSIMPPPVEMARRKCCSPPRRSVRR